MPALASANYERKSFIAEIIFLVFTSIVSPLAVGLQIFTPFSFTLSLVLLNILTIPSIILFYRGYLPLTFGKKRYWLAFVLFPIYLLIYEFNGRLGAIVLINMPFIPEGYREALLLGHPSDISTGYFHQSIGYTLLVLLSATSLYSIKLLFKNQNRLYIVQTEKLKLELNHLKSQVQPHFFFNTLNNLYSLSIQGSPKTPQMIADLSAIMRYVLYDTSNGKVTLEQEINFIKSYCNIENLRHDEKDMANFSIQGKHDGIKIEPLLFLPLIENAFKYGLHKNTSAETVKLVLSIDEDEIIFQTTNSNCKKSEVLNNTGGIGLRNLKQRLSIIYPERHELIIHDENENYTATLIIRYND